MKKVLLQVDQKGRDLVSVLLIGEYLKERGVQVFYSNPTNVVSMVVKHKPDLFMISATEGQFLQAARYIAPTSKVVLMSQEGACAYKEETVMRHTFNGMLECYTRGLSRVYLWGEISKQWLSEGKVYPEDIMKVVGTSRLDIYRLGVPGGKPKGAKLKVGFANRGESINPGPGANPIERIEAARPKEGSHRAYLDPGREWEDWVWHAVASMRINLNLIEMLSKSPDIEVIFRPDPFENVRNYEFLKRKYPNLSVNTDPVLFNFLDEIDVLVTEFSTTGTEALVLKKPVISTQKLLGPRLPEHNKKDYQSQLAHMRNYWHPEDEGEFFKMVERARKGDLPYSPSPADAEKYLKDFYGWDPEGPSSAYRIAADMVELMRTDKPKDLQELQRREFKEPAILDGLAAKLRLPAAVTRTLLAWPWLFALRAFVLGLKSGRLKTQLRMDYYPWDAQDNARVKAIFKRLKAATARWERP